MSMGNFPDILSQQILVGIILVGRLGPPGRVGQGERVAGTGEGLGDSPERGQPGLYRASGHQGVHFDAALPA